jgi:hypothetical protein
MFRFQTYVEILESIKIWNSFIFDFIQNLIFSQILKIDQIFVKI